MLHSASDIDPTLEAVRHMDAEQHAELGLQHAAYLTPGDRVAGGWTYAIRAANGQLLAVVDDIDEAVDLVCRNDLILVWVH